MLALIGLREVRIVEGVKVGEDQVHDVLAGEDVGK